MNLLRTNLLRTDRRANRGAPMALGFVLLLLAAGSARSANDAFVVNHPIQQEPLRNPSVGIDPSDNPGGVFLHSGELVLQRTDLFVRGRAMHFAFVRTYRSASERDGPLGHGWDANVFRRLEPLPSGNVRSHDGAGRVDTYLSQGGGAFQSPAGFYTRLRQTPGGFELRERDGRVSTFDASGRLLGVEDRIGNQHDYNYQSGQLASITDEFGRAIDFGYTNGRLTSVTDFSGRSVVFSHDGNGDLVQARSPLVTGTPHGNDFPSGKREQYVYDSNKTHPFLVHNLVAVIAPNEVEDATLVPCMTAIYGSGGRGFDRVKTQTVGGTNASGIAAGGTLSFEYDLAPSGGPAGTATRTRVTDRNGNTTDYFHSEQGHALGVVEEPNGTDSFTTLFEYNADGELTRRVEPLGNETQYFYDGLNPDRFQQGNLLEERQIPDAARGGDQVQISTTFTHEPLYTRLLTETQARGNDPTYAPQNGGANSPARYTTTYTYDYQESQNVPAEATDWGITIPGSLLGKGDVNDDGRTDQTMGNRVRTEQPTVNLPAGSNQAQAEGDTLQEIVTLERFNDFGQLTQHEDARGNVDTFTYNPENDPDGDGQDTIPGADPVTGGYLAQTVEDALAGANRQDSAPLTQIARTFALDLRGNVLVSTDGRGHDRTVIVNALDQVMVEEDPQVEGGMATGYQRRFHYDASDNLVQRDVQNWKADDTGNQVLDGTHPWFEDVYVFDILDRCVEQIRDASRDPAIPASTEPESLVTEFEYDGNENVVRVHTPAATSGADPDNVLRMVYDERDLLVQRICGEGSLGESTWTYEFDDNENLIHWIDAEDNDSNAGPETESFVYDGYDRPVTRTDREGNEYARTYDPDNRVIREERSGPAGGSGGPFVILEGVDSLYDELGRPFQVDTDLFVPIAPTLPVSVVDGGLTPGDGKVSERTEYDSLSRVTFEVEDDLAVYAFEFDGADRVIREVVPLVDPNGIATDAVHTYDANDNRVRTEETHTSPEGFAAPAILVHHYVFDSLDRVVRTTNPLGETRYFDYDSRDNCVAELDERGTLIPDPLGLFTGGNINDRGNAVRYAYDGIDRLWLTEKELHEDGQGDLPLVGTITRFSEYDANDNLVRETDAEGNSTSYDFDSLNRRTVQTNADGGTRTWDYDRDHNVTQLVDENGSVHSMTYDGLDRLVDHDIAPSGRTIDGTGLPLIVGTTERTFDYDGLSRATTCTDNNDPADPSDDWTVTLVWDSLSRVIEEVQGGTPVGSSFVADDRSELVYPHGSRSLGFAYDAHDQLIGISDPRFQVDRAYLGTCSVPIAQGCFSLQPNPVLALDTQNQLDGNKLLQGSSHVGAGGNPVGQHGVARTRDRQIEGMGVMLMNGPNFLDQQYQCALSSIDQIVDWNVVRDDGNGPSGTQRSIQYGGAQQILQIFEGANLLENRNYDDVYERSDAPFQFNGGAQPGTGVRSGDGNYIYQFDGLNRLCVVRDANAPAVIVSEYDYDSAPAVTGGRRVRRDVNNSGSLDGSTRFYYDGVHVIEEADAGTDQTERQYVFTLRLDDVVIMDLDTNANGNPDQLFFVAKDASGSATHLLDAQGQLVEFYTYDLFDTPTVLDPFFQPQPTSQVLFPFLFGGMYWEPAIDLYFNDSCFVDVVTGDVLNRPFDIWGNSVNDGNGFVWSGNNPWNFDDPLGMGVGGGCGGVILIDNKAPAWPPLLPPLGPMLPGDPLQPFPPLGPPLGPVGPIDPLGAPGLPLLPPDPQLGGLELPLQGMLIGDGQAGGAGAAPKPKPKPKKKPKIDVKSAGGKSLGTYDPEERKLVITGGGWVMNPLVRDRACGQRFTSTATASASVPCGAPLWDWTSNLKKAAKRRAAALAALRCPPNCRAVRVSKWTVKVVDASKFHGTETYTAVAQARFECKR